MRRDSRASRSTAARGLLNRNLLPAPEQHAQFPLLFEFRARQHVEPPPAAGGPPLARETGLTYGSRFMSPSRFLCGSIAAVALAIAADTYGQAEPFTSSGEAVSDPAVSSAAAPVEPTPLSGDIPTEATVALETVEEPALPEPESPQAATPVVQQPEELAATPRRFRYAIGVEARSVYDDNITLSHVDRREDFYFQLSPRFVLGLGDLDEKQENYVSVDYSPSAYLFVDNSDFNTLEHIGELTAQWRFSRLTLTARQNLQMVQSANLDVADETGGVINQVNLDVGGRRQLNTYTSQIDAVYDLTGKTALRVELDYYVTDHESSIDSSSVSAAVGFNYKYGPKLSLGLAGRLGRRFVEGASPDGTYEQVNVRWNYDVSGKLRVTGSGGLEWRQSDDTDETRVSPLLQIGVAYAPFDGTELGASVVSRTFNSASEIARDFESTQFVLRARQRLLQRIYLSLVAGYQTQSYHSTISGVSSGRDDNYHFVAPGFDVNLTRFWSAGVYYLRRQNDSSAERFSFNDNQLGFRTTLQF